MHKVRISERKGCMISKRNHRAEEYNDNLKVQQRASTTDQLKQKKSKVENRIVEITLSKEQKKKKNKKE